MAAISPVPYDPDYGYLNGLAHNRTITWVRAPALVGHICFWYPGSEIEENPPKRSGQPKPPSEREKWKNIIDDTIADVFDTFQNANIPTRNDCSMDNYIVLFNSVRSSGDPKCILSADNYANIFMNSESKIDSTMKDDRRTINLYAYEGALRISLKFQVHSEYFTVSYFLEISDEFFDGRGNLGVGGGGKIGIAKLFAQTPGFCDQLNKFASSLHYACNDTSHITEYEEISNYFYNELCEEIFKILPADIRASNKDSKIGKKILDFRGLVLSDETVRLAVETIDHQRPLTWGERANVIFGPLVANVDLHETTASYLLDGRAYYATSLGYNRSAITSNPEKPLKFLMYVHQSFPGDRSKTVVNKWQLGRLIDRLFELGTLRLAALVDLNQLRKGGEILAELEPLTKIARDALTRGEQFETQDRISDVNSKFNQLSIRNGIQYRVERSRYYVDQFRSGIPWLRIQRIEGFQPYNQFVEQRLGASYDFINRLGIRYERAATAVARLVEDGVSLKLKSIQIFGEFFLLIILLPYYFCNLLEHVVKEDGHMSWNSYSVVWSCWAGLAATRTPIFERILRKMSKIKFNMRLLLKIITYVIFISLSALVFLFLLSISHFYYHQIVRLPYSIISFFLALLADF